MVTSRLCLGLWLVLAVLSMVFEMSLLPVFILLLVSRTQLRAVSMDSEVSSSSPPSQAANFFAAER